jgi:Cu2+-exporting ATPase
MSPADKLARVRELQAQGRRVLMVGDGINDAPVLAAADASVAVGEATALARTAADAVLLAGGLRRVIDLVAMARDTRRVIVQNLGWATLYNLVAIPAAAFGLVPPWVAAIGMSASSLLVVGNALRLRVRPWKRSTSSSR